MTIAEHTPRGNTRRRPARAVVADSDAERTKAAAPAPMENARLIARTRLRWFSMNVDHREPDGEFTDSVREHGIIQAVIVRPAPRLPSPMSAGAISDFEIVDGECRTMAAGLVGLAQIPCIVLDLSDEQAFDVNNVANMKRRRLSPMQEAALFGIHRDRFGRNPLKTSEKVGKPAKYIEGRLLFLLLEKDAQQDVHTGRMLPSVAIEIALLPPEDRAEAYALVRPRGDSVTTLREARSLFDGHFHLRMVNATFPIDDADLVKGRPACTRCPDRSENQMLLVSEGVDNVDRCLNRGCWDLKTAAAWARRSAEAAKCGTLVLDARAEGAAGEAAQLVIDNPETRGFLNLDTECTIVTDALLANTWRALLEKRVPIAAVVRTTRPGRESVIELVDEKEALRALAASGHALPDSARAKIDEPSPAPELPAKAENEPAKWEIVQRDRELVVVEIIKAMVPIAEATPPKPGSVWWRTLIAAVVVSLDHSAIAAICRRRKWTNARSSGETFPQALLRHAAKANEQVLRGLLVEAIAHLRPEAAHALAEGQLDLKALEASARRDARSELRAAATKASAVAVAPTKAKTKRRANGARAEAAA